MSRRRVACALAGLAVGLIFYLGYRSDRTLSNRLLHAAVGQETFQECRRIARACLPMPAPLHGCLPSALWCLIGTSLIGGWKIELTRGRALALGGFCPCFNAAWEIVQWLGWTDGHADPLDVVAGIAGWAVAWVLFRESRRAGSIPLTLNWRFGVMLAAVACMGFADVWR